MSCLAPDGKTRPGKTGITLCTASAFIRLFGEDNAIFFSAKVALSGSVMIRSSKNADV